MKYTLIAAGVLFVSPAIADDCTGSLADAVQLRVEADFGPQGYDFYKLDDPALGYAHYRARTGMRWAEKLKPRELSLCYISWLNFVLVQTEHEAALRKDGLGHQSDVESEWSQAEARKQRIPKVP